MNDPAATPPSRRCGNGRSATPLHASSSVICAALCPIIYRTFSAYMAVCFQTHLTLCAFYTVILTAFPHVQFSQPSSNSDSQPVSSGTRLRLNSTRISSLVTFGVHFTKNDAYCCHPFVHKIRVQPLTSSMSALPRDSRTVSDLPSEYMPIKIL